MRLSPQLKNVVLGFLICCATLAFGLFTRRDDVELTLQMSSRVSSSAQIFYDTGSGFRESESRNAEVPLEEPGHFSQLTFTLPDGVRRLRFDPLTTAGSFVIRNVALIAPGGALRITPDRITQLNQIATRVARTDEVEFSTLPYSNDSSLLLGGDLGPQLRDMKLRHAFYQFLLGLPLLLTGALVVLWLLGQPSSAGLMGRLWQRINATFASWANRLSSPAFIQFDTPAIWFYALCGLVFLVAGLANLNGSSVEMFHSAYGHGAKQEALLGAARPIRSDEWSYETPIIINQSLRDNRFAARQTEIGSHYAGLFGNIPVAHISTFFRPQFWPFFLLPVSYAFSFYWQTKALILLVGVFTWLLLLTGSSGWAAAGSLWFFFSPLIQWSYSWPSALPEMIGSACLAAVLACFLTVNRHALALALAAIGLVACCINFALCAYPPHMVPLFWLITFFFVAWCFAQRELIFTRRAAGIRSAALMAVVMLLWAAGALLYEELRPAILAIANTSYPGKRIFSSGSYPFYAFPSQFLAWTERENHFPPALFNICEGSGFLWLAPFTLLCIRQVQLSRARLFYCVSLWAAFCLLFAWLVLPVPLELGRLFGLQETGGSRVVPALGLTNVALVSLCMSSFQSTKGRDARHRSAKELAKPLGGELGTAPVSRGSREKPQSDQGSAAWTRFLSALVAAFLVMLFVLHATNRKLAFFFTRWELLLGAAVAGLLIALLITGRSQALALWLVLPQVVLFSAVNPLERGLPVFTSSPLFAFVHDHPALREGKWIVFSDTVVSSGFFEATGCDVYTGMHYLPDIDHFRLFAAHGYDIASLNESGFLTAHLRNPNELQRVEAQRPGVMQWDVRPSDSLVKDLGIKYAAFDQPLELASDPHLAPLAPGKIDGFWLYQLR
jgi:uncharacterized integral membrane protein